MIFIKKYSLLISFLWFIGGCTILFFYLGAERNYFTMNVANHEGRMINTIVMVTGAVGLLFNLASVYKSFSEKFRFATGAKLVFLNFPVMILQCFFVYGWFLVNAYF